VAPVSFRNKLAVFFFLVVVVPMLSVAFVLFRLIEDNESSKADARLASRQEVAANLTREARTGADALAVRIGRDRVLSAALAAGDRAAVQRRLAQLRLRTGAARLAIVRDGRFLADAGSRDAVFPAYRLLVAADGGREGMLEVSIARAQPFADRVATVTALDTVVAIGGRVSAETIDGAAPPRLPAERGTVRVRDVEYRASTTRTRNFSGETASVTVLEPAAVVAGDRRQSRLLVATLLAGFFALALTTAWFVARSLHRQLERFLVAARRIGSGDFSARVPTVGNDDFAQLGEEFNKMSAQLEARLHDLGVERERLRGALRRIGQAFASNLDRDALLQVVVAAAADGVGADAGRAVMRRETGSPVVVASAGDVAAATDALGAAEARALASGRPAETVSGERQALAVPMRPSDGSTLAVVSIARAGAPFNESDRDVFEYLAAQAATSIENVDLHERIEQQAVTDPLTALANRRRFEERLRAEVDRTRRFPKPVGLVMLDIDDFKAVNDRWGHVAGDDVLRAVAAALRANARDIDLAARYGGEELALILPGADLAGTEHAAERVRRGVEELDLPLRDDHGRPLHVTVSAGVAALGEGPSDAAELVAAADAALYRAKRAGKNRTERAHGAHVTGLPSG
jgi:diguanylate cyclase (GGDEF)-like protein